MMDDGNFDGRYNVFMFVMNLTHTQQTVHRYTGYWGYNKKNINVRETHDIHDCVCVTGKLSD